MGIVLIFFAAVFDSFLAQTLNPVSVTYGSR